MDRGEVRRAVFNIPSAEGGVRVDIVEGGRACLRLMTRDGVRDLFCDTLEELPQLAAAEPGLTGELYGQLMWELDLLGLRGE
ncbi:hypothetical protein E5F05_07060 [Deinococcus metallilatus]|uniref:Uncharacterized protein n=1 Tax=Deinococcus metallilatus TaxID=1211322 RepID=A0AAJ5F4X9_9DEIO|nr:hypothetical protein [Deinococcus metallilatus]MBB5294707.1 hypothetical protein [Deinococcus metallilatus]QBY07736.1 hypothetical protein E5F05_07060 [Deinococcus metallilatus]RXJ14152.1 hypothetical protein ERJ73_05895 [Deinococcus metallilatus]TLK30117.1 hypothetical protein FCS05_06210 [Deinococcus metallilatus]GMA15924.1 hypothetical protein GCM10025871_22550 [Deinococcus metallilatus]